VTAINIADAEWFNGRNRRVLATVVAAAAAAADVTDTNATSPSLRLLSRSSSL
jgi:hypothetical protein